MSEPVEEKQQSKPWEWPREWMHDEKFWRDVGSRTIAGFIVVCLGYFCAVALGYLQQPNYAKAFALMVFTIFAALAALQGIGLHLDLRHWSTDDTSKFWTDFRRRLIGPLVCMAIAAPAFVYLVLNR